MRKFKLNTNPAENEPSKEQLKRYKDFTTLAHSYQNLTKRPKKPLYKDPKMFLFIVLIGLIALLLFSA